MLTGDKDTKSGWHSTVRPLSMYKRQHKHALIPWRRWRHPVSIHETTCELQQIRKAAAKKKKQLSKLKFALTYISAMLTCISAMLTCISATITCISVRLTSISATTISICVGPKKPPYPGDVLASLVQNPHASQIEKALRYERSGYTARRAFFCTDSSLCD